MTVADHFGSFFKDVFPDSEIAKNYACGSTKSTCIINGSLAPYLRSSLVVALKINHLRLPLMVQMTMGLRRLILLLCICMMVRVKSLPSYLICALLQISYLVV